MERWAVELDALKCYTTRVGCMSRHWEGGYGLSLVCTKCCWILLLLLLLHLFSFRRRLQALMPQRGPSQLELQRDYVNRVFHKCGQHRYFTLQPYYQHAFVQTYCNHHWHNAATLLPRVMARSAPAKRASGHVVAARTHLLSSPWFSFGSTSALCFLRLLVLQSIFILERYACFVPLICDV